MSVVKMTGVSITGALGDVEKISSKLLSMGIFEPLPLDTKLGERFRDNPYDIPLEKVARLWKSAGLTPPDSVNERSPYISLEEANSFAGEISLKLDEWSAHGERLRDDRAATQAYVMIAEALAETGHRIEELTNAQNIVFSIGPILKENWERVLEISGASPLFVRALVKGTKRVLALVMYPREYKKEARKLFDAVHYQEYSGNAMKLAYGDLEDLKERFMFLDKESRDARHSAARYIEENREKCERGYSAICAMQRIYSLLQSRGEISGIVAISGFVPSENLEEVRTIAQSHSAVFLTETDDEVAERTQVPTLLKNNNFARSFQEIVNLYSLPSYGEFDPSPVVAFTFCLFFGMMFGDVGHGAALALGALLLERKGVMSKAFSKIIKIAGFVSMFFGVMYGSVFGDEEIISPIWVSPMKDTDNLIMVSIVIGIVFLSAGMVLKIWSLYKKGERGEFYFGAEGLAGMLFYWTACAAIVRMMSPQPFGGALAGWLLTFILIGLFVVILMEKYLTKKYFHHESETDGVVHVFSIFHAMLSFVSNTASFVRLAAFALNHAGLSMAVYMLADMVRATPGGKLSSILVVLIGNIIIVGLEGLIVFIQTLRLEYYEFFSKFFRGGGRLFAPLSWREKIE